MSVAPYPPDPTPRHLEERCLNAWPGVQQSLFDGWLVRFSQGYTKRANCAVPFYPGALEAEAKVAWCEGAYGRRGLPAIFKILPFGEPADLDERLDRRGYASVDRTVVLCRDVPAGAGETSVGAQVHDAVDSPYLHQYAGLNGIPRLHLPKFRDILSRTAGDIGYASVVRHGQMVACGLGILEGDHLGLYGIATNPDCRRQGLGRELLQSLLAWGAHRGAGCAYLQVRVDNAPARALYEAEGFIASYQYWYRVQPTV